MPADQDRVRQEAERLHELKTWPEFYEEIMSGRKPFEIRENDRDFRVGDVLHLREYVLGSGYTGRESRHVISYITNWKQRPRHVVLGLQSAQVAALQEEARLARGAMAAQDAREREAGERCGVSYDRHGCDWPDAVADQVAALQATVEELTKERDELRKETAR